VGLVLLLAPADAAHPALESARALGARLRSGGRAEAQVERRALDPFTGGWRSIRGRLALEPPDQALLEFPSTGERIALRGDGGEWLQPALEQMLRLGPENAAAARRWWELLLPAGGARFSEASLGGGRYALVPREALRGGGDTAWVRLDSSGLPSLLEYKVEGGARIAYRLRGWRFPRPRGRAGFVIEPPDSFQVVELP
jgi:hypothetical protein